MLLKSEDVAQFYEQMNEFLTLQWGENLHYGYWHEADDGASTEQAQEQMTDLVLGRTRARAGQRLLDVGCGVGAPAVRIAQATGCDVLGISTSRNHVELANQRAREAGLSERVTFQRADAQELPFEDASFDGVFALESMIHMPERSTVYNEVARVLRPGGRFVLTDFIERVPMTAEQQAVRDAFSVGFKLAPFPLLEDFPRMMRAAGLEMLELLNISDNILKTFPMAIDSIERKSEALNRLSSPEAVQGMKQLVEQVGLISERHIGYVLVVGVRR
jgi:cyclopropane fatty-acyl-phospholipid synthase-like methyltransferase